MDHFRIEMIVFPPSCAAYGREEEEMSEIQRMWKWQRGGRRGGAGRKEETEKQENEKEWEDNEDKDEEEKEEKEIK